MQAKRLVIVSEHGNSGGVQVDVAYDEELIALLRDGVPSQWDKVGKTRWYKAIAFPAVRETINDFYREKGLSPCWKFTPAARAIVDALPEGEEAPAPLLHVRPDAPPCVVEAARDALAAEFPERADMYRHAADQLLGSTATPQAEGPDDGDIPF